MMIQSSLQVTYLHGRPVAAYLYLPRRRGAKCFRTRELAPGLVVDFARGGAPMGIEILDPGSTTVVKVNRVLRQLGQPAVTRADLAPLRAA